MKMKNMIGVIVSIPIILSPFSLSYAKGDAGKGKTVFANNCATCHGVKGAGDGIAASSLNPKPANFAKGKFKYGSDDASLKKTIKNGKGSMPPWKAVLKPKQIDDVISYIRTLKGKK